MVLNRRIHRIHYILVKLKILKIKGFTQNTPKLDYYINQNNKNSGLENSILRDKETINEFKNENINLSN